jgi:hypothetical protein
MKGWGNSNKVFTTLKRAKARTIAALRKNSEIAARERRRKMRRKIY